MPEAIPYKTSYYKKNWGFCLSYKNYKKLKDKRYEVNINAEHKNGSMTISDLFIPGKVKKEIIVHTYTCHPSMAINEISGPLVVAFLAKDILNMKKKIFFLQIYFCPRNNRINNLFKKKWKIS